MNIPPLRKADGALPPYPGGKRGLRSRIFKLIEQSLDRWEWSNKVVLDVFTGAGSMSLAFKSLGVQAVHANDWSSRTQLVLKAVLGNQGNYLTKEDLLYLTQPVPDGISGYAQSDLVPHVLSTRHAEAVDRIQYWANQYQDETKRSLGLLLLWHLIQEYVCIPTSINSSNRPYAETLDGLRDWQDINPKRFVDGSFPKLLRPRFEKLTRLSQRINGGIFKGSPVYAYQQDANEFLQSQSGDLAYFDPPYAGTLSYESTFKTLDAILFGEQPETVKPISPFTKGVEALVPMFQSAQHIPVWVLSYGNHLVDLKGLAKLIQEQAPDRTVKGYEWGCRHFAHLSKAENRKELLVIAYK